MTQVQELLQRFSQLKTERSKWEQSWIDVSEVVNPNRQWWDDTDSSGKNPITLYDTTAIDALGTFSAGLQGYAVSPSFHFFKLKMKDELMDIPFVADWLEEVESVIYSALNKSNFYKAFDEFTKDAASTGTGIMYVEDDVKNDSINFNCRHPKECYIAEGANGRVDTIFRYFKITAKIAVEIFGLENCAVSWQDLYKNSPYTKVTLLQVIMPRWTDGVSNKSMKCASYYIDYDNQQILEESGFNEFPFLVWRYDKNSDEVYGRGIGSNSLPEVLRLNQMAKSLLQAGEIANFPPLNIPMNMKGRENLAPRGRNYYDAMSGKIEAINMGSKFPYCWQEYTDQRELVKNKFHVNFFMMLQQLEKSGMTATEIMERQSELAAILGTIIGRLNSECLSPLLDRVYSILARKLMIPAPPEQLLREGGEIQIEYMGPLAQAQRRFNQNQGVIATLGLIQSLVQVEGIAKQSGGTVIDNFDMDELSRIGADASGSPQKGIRETPERDKIRQIRAQIQQQIQQQQIALQQQQMLAQNADKLNKPMQQGSMIEKVTGG